MKIVFEEKYKWDDPWHLELPPLAKVLKDYLHCSCDPGGFVKWSESIASFKTGIPRDQIAATLDFLTKTKDVDGYRVFYRNKFIYLDDHIQVQDKNGLSVTNTAHGGILKRLFAMIDIFPECIKYFPDSHSTMKESIELYIKKGGAANKESAMKGLLKELNKVTPAKIKKVKNPIQQDLFEVEIPGVIKECLRILSLVPGYPFNFDTDRGFLMELSEDFGLDGFLFVLKGKVAWWLDKPITKNNKPRSQMRNWFHNHYVRFPAEERKKKQAKEDKGKKLLKDRAKKAAADRRAEDIAREKEIKEVKKANEWLDKHIEEKDIPAVIKKMEIEDNDRNIAIFFINQRRKAQGMELLEGGKII